MSFVLKNMPKSSAIHKSLLKFTQDGKCFSILEKKTILSVLFCFGKFSQCLGGYGQEMQAVGVGQIQGGLGCPCGLLYDPADSLSLLCGECL